MSRRVLTALASGLFAAATLAPSVAHAWVPIDPSQPRWKTLPVTYKINQSTIPPSITNIAVARVDAAFATWGAPACSAWAAVDGGNTALSYNYNDGSNTIRWISQNWPAQLGDVNSVIGVTMPVWDNSGAIYDADIVFNDVGFNWNDSGSAGYVDTQSIATHEEGHFLGLGHTNVAGATMQPAYSGGTSLRTIEQDDITGVCTLYPSGNGTSAAATTSGGGGDCQTCANSSVQGACSSQYQACGQQQDCVDFANCYGACSDQSCVDSCVSQHPSGAQTYSNMIDCICQDCSVECSAECGGGSSGSTTSGGSGTSGPSGATTGSGSGTGSAGATTGGVGGAGAGSGGGSAASGWGNGGDDSSGSGDGAAIQQTPACACQTPGGGSAGGLGAVGLLAGLGLFFARRRR